MDVSREHGGYFKYYYNYYQVIIYNFIIIYYNHDLVNVIMQLCMRSVLSLQ